jgi:precorrin-3B methylase
MRGHSSTNLILNLNFTFTDDVEESIETAAEGGMLDDLYNILTNTKNQTQCKVVQILAELAKVGEYINRFI